MKTKYAPAPWKFDGRNLVDSKGEWILELDFSDYSSEENRRLIETAPELLEALQELSNVLGQPLEKQNQIFAKARAAIKKATL